MDFIGLLQMYFSRLRRIDPCVTSQKRILLLIQAKNAFGVNALFSLCKALSYKADSVISERCKKSFPSKLQWYSNQ
jgi:hypothetical protein